jgi:hypothetical protein
LIKPSDVGKCPHCSEKLRFESGRFVLANLQGVTIKELDSSQGVCEIHGAKETIKTRAAACPSCGKPIVTIVPTEEEFAKEEGYLAYPQGSIRPIPQEVLGEDQIVTEDYQQASIVSSLSPKASAALSRRCLQTILIKKANADPNAKLGPQIDGVLRSGTLPGYISKNLDAIRNFGNFGAHPMFTAVGEIVQVEPNEAEWTLDIIDDLFDFYYVKPAQAAAKRAALDAKLKQAGKPPMKK